MTQQAVIQVLQDLAEQSIATTDILTDKVLSISQRHIVWYLPAGKRRIFIDTKTNGRQSAIVPHPTLIFAVVDGGWSIFAVAKPGRPNQDTLIYHAPFLNVYDNGLICTGSAKTPKSMAVRLRLSVSLYVVTCICIP
jgi:PRTRC genetic system protein B